MKIAHIISTFPPYYSGTGMVCYYNALELGRMGHDVTVFTANHPPGEYDYPPEFRVECLPVLFRFGNAPFLPGLLKLRDFDIFHLHHPFIFGAESTWAVSKIRNIPMVLTHHNDLIGDGLRPYLFDSYSAISKRLLFTRASKLLVVSKDHARSSLLGEDFDRRWSDVIEVPNGVDIDLFRPGIDSTSVRRELGIPLDAPALLFVGALDRAHHFRRVDLLIEAVSILQQPNLHLLVVGDGDRMSFYQQLSRDRGINSFVHFLGRTDHDQLPNIYSAADILVLPSHIQESFGMVLIEAMACGRPVIASDLPGVRTVVADGGDGFLVRPGDAADLVSKISMMLELPAERRQQMGVAGRRKVEERYSWQRIGDMLERLYIDVLDQRQLARISVTGKKRMKANR